MTELNERTKANLAVVLEEVCRPLPHGGDHELRKAIAEKLLVAAMDGDRTIGKLTDVARAALAELTKRSASDCTLGPRDVIWPAGPRASSPSSPSLLSCPTRT